MVFGAELLRFSLFVLVKLNRIVPIKCNFLTRLGFGFRSLSDFALRNEYWLDFLFLFYQGKDKKLK